jgi:ProP effector
MSTEAAPPPAPPEHSAEACAALLKQHFPALFAGAPKPLQLRIQADIQARVPGVFSKAMLSAFLRHHTGRTAYLIALSRATQRFDLDGAPSSELSAEHRQAAFDELARRKGLRESRLALQEEQRRNRAQLLRSFQDTTLTAANFCALKGIAVGELDAILAAARQEAVEAARAAPPFERQFSDRSPRSARRRG